VGGPSEAAAKPNPLAGNSAAIAGGRKLFTKNCSRCHGEDGSGRGSAADLQLGVVQQQRDGSLFWKITNGNLPRRMPS
jgi:mono/diheme cytochrome c family protein